MIRLGSIVVMLLVSSTSAWAATAVKVEGTSGSESKVGREGAWRSAAVGATIGETDFLAIPAGATVRVTLPDGKVASFAGKIVVPGRRLVSAKTSASNAAWLAHAIQSASDAMGGVTAGQDGPGASKPENVGGHLQLKETGPRGGGSGSGVESGGAKRTDSSGAKGNGRANEKDADVKPVSRATAAATRATPTPVPVPAVASAAAVQAETPPQAQGPQEERSSNNRPEADSFVEESESKGTTGKSVAAMIAETPRTASLRAGLASESEGNFKTANTMLTEAAAKGAKDEGDVRAIRAEALVALGRIQLQEGNAEAAAAHFNDAIKLDAENGKTGPHAARAWYLLGIAALERGDVKGAQRKFKRLKGYPDLEAAAKRAFSERSH